MLDFGVPGLIIVFLSVNLHFQVYQLSPQSMLFSCTRVLAFIDQSINQSLKEVIYAYPGKAFASRVPTEVRKPKLLGHGICCKKHTTSSHIPSARPPATSIIARLNTTTS